MGRKIHKNPAEPITTVRTAVPITPRPPGVAHTAAIPPTAVARMAIMRAERLATLGHKRFLANTIAIVIGGMASPTNSTPRC